MTIWKLQNQVLKSEIPTVFLTTLTLLSIWCACKIFQFSFLSLRLGSQQIYSLIIFNYSSRNKKELPPISPRRYLTCSQAWSAPLASLPILSGEKRGHQGQKGQRQLKSGLNSIDYKNVLVPINFFNDCSWKNINSCQTNQNTDNWTPIVPQWWRRSRGLYRTWQYTGIATDCMDFYMKIKLTSGCTMSD